MHQHPLADCMQPRTALLASAGVLALGCSRLTWRGTAGRCGHARRRRWTPIIRVEPLNRQLLQPFVQRAPGAALLGGAAAKGAGDAGPLGAVARHQPPQRPVLPRGPGGAAAGRRSRGQGPPQPVQGRVQRWDRCAARRAACIRRGGAAAMLDPEGMWAGEAALQAHVGGLAACKGVPHLMAGSRCRRQRPMHCWSVRPCGGSDAKVHLNTCGFCAPDERGVRASSLPISSHAHTKQWYEPHIEEQAATHEAAQVGLQAAAGLCLTRCSPPCRGRSPPSSCHGC
jgi:hypothetical protein